MTPERWQEMKEVLAGALERTPTERRAYLDQACADASLRREVESLIAANEQGDTSFLEQPAIESRRVEIRLEARAVRNSLQYWRWRDGRGLPR